MVARHDLDLPDGETLHGLYLPAPLEPGDQVQVEGNAYVVEQALTIIDDLHGAVVRARLKLAAPG